MRTYGLGLLFTCSASKTSRAGYARSSIEKEEKGASKRRNPQAPPRGSTRGGEAAGTRSSSGRHGNTGQASLLFWNRAARLYKGYLRAELNIGQSKRPICCFGHANTPDRNSKIDMKCRSKRAFHHLNNLYINVQRDSEKFSLFLSVCPVTIFTAVLSVLTSP